MTLEKHKNRSWGGRGRKFKYCPLRQKIGSRKIPDFFDYVFTEEDGYVINPQTPTKQFSKFLKRNGIRHLKFHRLRHTSATMLLVGGCDIKTVSSRLGYADITTTNIYVHTLESTDRMAAQTFDNLLRKNSI